MLAVSPSIRSVLFGVLASAALLAVPPADGAATLTDEKSADVSKNQSAEKPFPKVPAIRVSTPIPDPSKTPGGLTSILTLAAPIAIAVCGTLALAAFLASDKKRKRRRVLKPNKAGG